MRNFTSYFSSITCLFALTTVWFLCGGCAVSEPKKIDIYPADKFCTLYCYRLAGYAGQGRTHILKLDNRAIGTLTDNNYYLIELWPGTYEFTVQLPAETFFGATNPALSIGKHLELKFTDAGQSFILEYSDGIQAASFKLSPGGQSVPELKQRHLAAALKLRDTAKIKQLYDAVYDGPTRQDVPHGCGTLSWPDGSYYQGFFEYGEPTTQGAFVFPDGLYYKGTLREGRPFRSGVFFTKSGDIIFTGNILDEKPDGQGLRTGEHGPEFCTYSNGTDITKSVEEQSLEAIDEQELKQTLALFDAGTAMRRQIEEEKKRLEQLQQHHHLAMDKDSGNTQGLENQTILIADMEQNHSDIVRKTEQLREELFAQHEQTRYTRLLDMRLEIVREHEEALERERIWCRGEFSRGRRWCLCAPFADDFSAWPDCLEQ